MTTTDTSPQKEPVPNYPYDPIGDDGSPFSYLSCASIAVQAVAVVALTVWFLAEVLRRIL